jgi:diguanylate cyclase (GGDEF)-like protein
LTGLPNRAALEQHIKTLADPLAVHVDIDDFKTYNDLYGISSGNAILQRFAERLKSKGEALGARAFRTGSDDFVLLFSVSPDGRERMMQQIDELLQGLNHFRIELPDAAIEIEIEISAGIAWGSSQVLEEADMALQKALDSHALYEVFREDEQEREARRRRFEIIQILQYALRHDAVVPYFQPIVSTLGKTTGYEALMRIEKDGEVLAPGAFLSVAIRSKLYAEISRQMIRKSLGWAANVEGTISVNLSYYDIENDETVKMILNELDRLGVGERIIFEITENESLKDFNKILAFIAESRKRGTKVAIDDFGSGYSNFAYLLRLQPDFIKIDGSIIKSIDHEEEARIIAGTIVDFARKLNIMTVAEFVHSKKVFETAKALGVSKFQGYLFAEPGRMPS